MFRKEPLLHPPYHSLLINVPLLFHHYHLLQFCSPIITNGQFYTPPNKHASPGIANDTVLETILNILNIFLFIIGQLSNRYTPFKLRCAIRTNA